MSVENTHFGAKRIKTMLAGCRNYHFIGIGGVSMSSLALLTRRLGFAVTGSDRMAADAAARLAPEGIRVFPDHRAEHLSGAEAVIYTVAISPDNPEYREAERLGLPLLSRADYMGYLMTAFPRRIGISGMHGKSSTTAMCAQVLTDAGTDPTVFCGAEMPSLGGCCRIGGKETFLFEACEYMDSFLDFSPTVAVLLNLELDHVDYFKSMEQVRASFGKFAALTGRDGFAVVSADNRDAMLAAEGYEGTLLTFGRTPDADFTARNVEKHAGFPAFDIYRRGAFLCHVTLHVPGEFQISNALAAAAVCDLCGVPAEQIGAGLSTFGGAARRMEYKGTFRGAAVWDDYGHHPTEVRVTLEGARELGYSRLFAVFQSHTYSRTAGLYEEFLTAFDACDEVYIAPIYAARETDTLGITPEGLAGAINRRAGRDFAFAPGDLPAIADALRERLRPGDGLVVMGAGDIHRLFPLLT